MQLSRRVGNGTRDASPSPFREARQGRNPDGRFIMKGVSAKSVTGWRVALVPGLMVGDGLGGGKGVKARAATGVFRTTCGRKERKLHDALSVGRKK